MPNDPRLKETLAACVLSGCFVVLGDLPARPVPGQRSFVAKRMRRVVGEIAAPARAAAS